MDSKNNTWVLLFLPENSTATERLGEEAMITVGNKTFSRNGNIYSGIGPDDALVSYGTHSWFFTASFSISSNNKRASVRRDVTEYVPKNQVEESDDPVSQLELLFQVNQEVSLIQNMQMTIRIMRIWSKKIYFQ